MASLLRWHLPAPSRLEVLAVRLAWLALMGLALGWFVSVGWDVATGRVPVWHGLLALLLVCAWAGVTLPLVRSVGTLPPVLLIWREADRDHEAAWLDVSGQPVHVRVLVDLGFGVGVRCTWSVEARVRWVPASALTTEVRWRLFQGRHQAVASSGLLPDEKPKLQSLAQRPARTPPSPIRQTPRAHHGRRQA